jgi:hypothetical protein
MVHSQIEMAKSRWPAPNHVLENCKAKDKRTHPREGGT